MHALLMSYDAGQIGLWQNWRKRGMLICNKSYSLPNRVYSDRICQLRDSLSQAVAW